MPLWYLGPTDQSAVAFALVGVILCFCYVITSTILQILQQSQHGTKGTKRTKHRTATGRRRHDRHPLGRRAHGGERSRATARGRVGNGAEDGID